MNEDLIMRCLKALLDKDGHYSPTLAMLRQEVIDALKAEKEKEKTHEMA